MPFLLSRTRSFAGRYARFPLPPPLSRILFLEINVNGRFSVCTSVVFCITRQSNTAKLYDKCEH